MSIREQIETKVRDEASAASIKQHERNIETLYIDSDGEVFWDAQPSVNTWLQREDGTLESIYKTGCGGYACNCEACGRGEDPREWAGCCDGIGELADLLAEKLAEIPCGFFEDESTD